VIKNYDKVKETRRIRKRIEKEGKAKRQKY
jgi:hypothetical protein